MNKYTKADIVLLGKEVELYDTTGLEDYEDEEVFWVDEEEEVFIPSQVAEAMFDRDEVTAYLYHLYGSNAARMLCKLLRITDEVWCAFRYKYDLELSKAEMDKRLREGIDDMFGCYLDFVLERKAENETHRP